MNDHDLLIKVTTNQDILCQKFEKLDGKVDKIVDKMDQKISWKPFVAVLSILVTIAGAIIGFNYNMDGEQWKVISENKDAIHECAKEIEGD